MAISDQYILGMVRRSSDGRYIQHGQVEEASCVLGFSFGYRLNHGQILPGQSNDDIANFIETHYSHLPKILQFEIADAMPTEKDVYRIQHHRIPGKYLDTREVAFQAREIMQRQGWIKAILMAHPNHVPRVDAICKKLGIFTIVPEGLEVIRFDSLSEQLWTRNGKVWAEHEANSIPYAAKQGWI